MTTGKNAEHFWQNKSRFYFVEEEILAFTSNTDFIKEVKNLPPNFKRITQRWLML